MGRLTASKSGEIASFKTPYATDIKSLKVHFSPKQMGSGDPSPENIREIVGWDGVDVYKTGKNIAHITGYSAINTTHHDPSRMSLTNSYGTAINTTYFNLPDTELIITQSKYPNTTSVNSYQNGYFNIGVDNLIWNKYYNVYFKITNINNPLNVELTSMLLQNPNGGNYRPIVNGDYLIFKNVLWKQNNSTSDIEMFSVRNCGMSFTLSEFMVTSVEDEDFKYEPYKGNIISYQWKRLPDEYQEVEYIESDGGQYIELPFGFNNTDEVIIKASEQSLNRDKFLIAPKTWDTTSRFAMVGGGYNNLFGVGYGNMVTTVAGTNFTSSTRDMNIHTWKYKDYIFSITDLEVDPLNVSGIPFSKETSALRLFFGYSSNSIGKIIYYYHKKINGTICELIPCYRKSDNEIGMYDIVSNIFYTNQGTGSFTKGNDVEYAKEIYGGTVDLITGELVQEYAKLPLTSDLDYKDRSTTANAHFYMLKTIPTGTPWAATDYCFSNVFNRVLNENEWSFWLNPTIKAFQLYVPKTISTVNAFKDYLTDKSFYIVYKLETPITYQLSPQQLRAFAGQNNLWSNADSVEVSYELIDTPDIQRTKKRIILNQPHVETVEGDIVGFNTDMRALLKECKVSFLPVQEGSGDPSPDNIRNISGWDEVKTYHSKKNIAHIVGYSAQTVSSLANRRPSNSYGTTINTIDFSLPDTELVVTQDQYPETSNINHYRNGFFVVLVDNLVFDKRYNISFKIDNIISDPLNAGLNRISILNPSGSVFPPSIINGNRIIYKNVLYRQYSNNTSRQYFEIRPCGMSFTLSEFMVTPVNDEGFDYESYQGNIVPIDWTDEAGTIYGGYADLVNGELVATYAILENKWNEYKNNYKMTNVNRRSFLFPYLKYNTGAATDVKCNIAIAQHSLADIVHFYLAKENNNVYMFLPKDLDEETVIQVVAKIAEPIHYSLTPQQILTLKQTNNIYANTNGNIEVKYWKH